jgi:DNA-binding NarL/FixJ family response regulator
MEMGHMKKTVLLLNDDHLFRELLRDFLETIGAFVLEAFSAEEAIDQMAAHQVDLVIVDLGLPGFPGMEFLEAVQFELPDIQCLVVSGQQASVVAEECREFGAVDYFQKPVCFTEFGECVKSCLQS